MELNTIGIAGIVAAAPERHHNIYGQKDIYALWLDITRDSGIADRVLVLFQERSIEVPSFIEETIITLYSGDKPVLTETRKTEPDYETPGGLATLIKEGSSLEVTGQLQTYKDRNTGRSQLFVWGTYLAAAPEESQQLNVAYINGEVVRQPVYRETPLGRHITDLALRVPSVFTPGYTCTIPCITWGRNAVETAYLDEGTTVYLEGRLQSREYMKGDQVLTTWEVSASKVDTKE